MALPQLAVLGVVTVALWLFYWRSEPTRYEVPPQLRPRNRRTFALAGVCTAMFIGGILAGVSIAVAAVVTAALLTLGFVRWDRSSLSWNLISWRLLVFVTGLFLVVDTIGAARALVPGVVADRHRSRWRRHRPGRRPPGRACRTR